MPKIRIILDKEFGEDHVIAKDDPIEKFVLGIAKAAEAQIFSYTVIDPYCHTHDWYVTRSNKATGGRTFVACKNCSATGSIHHEGSRVDRDQQFSGDKYFYCNEPKRQLKPFKIQHGIVMPKLHHE